MLDKYWNGGWARVCKTHDDGTIAAISGPEVAAVTSKVFALYDDGRRKDHEIAERAFRVMIGAVVGLAVFVGIDKKALMETVANRYDWFKSNNPTHKHEKKGR